MKKTKFYDYLKVLTPYELNRLLKYIQSPLFNEDEKLKALFKAVVAQIKKCGIDEVSEAANWKAVYGNKPFNKARYNRLLSDSVKKVGHFLVVDRFQQNKSLQHASQLAIMNERQLTSHIPEFLNYALKKQAGAEILNSDHYYNKYFIEQQKNIYIEGKEQRNAEKNLEQVIAALDDFYFVEKLKYCAALLHYKQFLSVESHIPLLTEILSYLQTSIYGRTPLVDIYKAIILSHSDNGDEHFARLKELIIKHQSRLERDEVKNIYMFAMNFCINKINFGVSAYLREVFVLYKYALDADILLEAGQLSPWDYKNIVTTALRLKEYKWALAFINDYKPILPKTERSNAYTFNLARYYFAIKNYDGVLKLLQEVKYNDIYYQLDAKTTLLKTYYELGEWQPLYSLKDSFRVLLRRKKLINATQKANYTNLLNYSIKLFNLGGKKDAEKIKKLKQEIVDTTNVADKSWLLDKVSEVSY